VNKNLAIVIPAYKSTFLRETLESIANQTNKNFTLYIGDDASPYDLFRIVKEYEGKMDIVYKKFEYNLGGKDLVAQWERCVDLTKNEEWLWMFSDDDVMNKCCVEEFYATLREQKSDIYHFNIKIIDDNGSIIVNCTEYPLYLSAYDFFPLLFTNKIEARMPEFVFNKEIFFEKGRFQKYDLAFRTDTATVMKNGLQNGIRTIPNCLVYWRLSAENVSGPHCNMHMIRKVRASILFFRWARELFMENKIPYPLSLKTTMKILSWEIVYPIYLKWKSI
jgi:glycosyltransferase involved in cell wall biosynthesis